jgi:hypothetical protein
MNDLSPPAAQARPVRAPRGTDLSCANWLIEAAYRMLQNNLDPEVAENPDALVVYGGIGKAARDWASFDAILATLRRLRADESLLIQSGKPVGVFRTHEDAPRVLIANSNLVPKWATWEHFDELDRKGLMMYGQMTAGSWIYIGSQGIVQGTYETFVEAGRQHYPRASADEGSEWAGRWILTAGLGGMGGAQPLAATFAGACSLNIECQQSRIDFRLRSRYLDEQASDLDDALARIAHYTSRRQAVSIGLLGNAAELLPALVERARAGGPRPDLVTDQTSAHDLVNGYLPAGWSVRSGTQRRPIRRSTRRCARRPRPAAPPTCGRCSRSSRWACRRWTTATTSGKWRSMPGSRTRSTFPASSRLHPAAVLPRQGAVPLGGAVGRSGGHPQDRRQDEGTVPAGRAPAPLARHGRRADRLPGAAGAHLLDRSRRAPPRGSGIQRDGAIGRTEGTNRHRSGSSRQRLGRVAQPRDRGDA